MLELAGITFNLGHIFPASFERRVASIGIEFSIEKSQEKQNHYGSQIKSTWWLEDSGAVTPQPPVGFSLKELSHRVLVAFLCHLCRYRSNLFRLLSLVAADNFTRCYRLPGKPALFRSR